MTEKELIDTMVSCFLSWKLPKDFYPDAGISFTPEYNVEYMAKQGLPPSRHEPSGTNLFHVGQAKEMFEYCALEALAAWEAEKLEPLRREVAMLRNTLMAIEAVGMYYVESSNIYFTCPECEFNQSATYEGVRHAKDCMVQNALNKTQATAESYDREHAAKVLEEAADKLQGTGYDATLRHMAAELRTAKRKEGLK